MINGEKKVLIESHLLEVIYVQDGFIWLRSENEAALCVSRLENRSGVCTGVRLFKRS
jgi:hypothetical protein